MKYDIIEPFSNEEDADEVVRELLENEALELEVVECVQSGPDWIVRITVDKEQSDQGRYDLGHCNGYIMGYRRAMEIRFMMKSVGRYIGSVEEQEEAQRWLMDHDPEGKAFWAGLPIGSDFISAKEDNIRDFGDPNEEKREDFGYPQARSARSNPKGVRRKVSLHDSRPKRGSSDH